MVGVTASYREPSRALSPQPTPLRTLSQCLGRRFKHRETRTVALAGRPWHWRPHGLETQGDDHGTECLHDAAESKVARDGARPPALDQPHGVAAGVTIDAAVTACNTCSRYCGRPREPAACS